MSTLTDNVQFFAPFIEDHRSLCELLGKTERELLIAQTIHACLINLKERDEAFSFKVALRDGPHFENLASYKWLIDNGLIREELRHATMVNAPRDVPRNEEGDVTVIIPTEELFRMLSRHFGKGPEATMPETQAHKDKP